MEKTTFRQTVSQQSGESPARCLGCLKCTAGCPLYPWMDYGPTQVIRLIQLGQKERLLKSSTIWLCVGCETCVARCPMKIDIAKIMDALREMALKEGYEAKEPNIPLFHNLFLSSVKKRGRVFEAEFLGWYKLKSRELFKDMKLGMEMFKRGKIPLWPSRIKAKGEVRQMFK
ncbi:MAG: 4Fe-4S dicluster domain-containing protein [bacterium]